jgi:hypothetical protein
MINWIKKPPKQLIFSLLNIAIAAVFVTERIANARFGWAAFWFIVGCLHLKIVLDELRRMNPKRGR